MSDYNRYCKIDIDRIQIHSGDTTDSYDLSEYSGRAATVAFNHIFFPTPKRSHDDSIDRHCRHSRPQISLILFLLLLLLLPQHRDALHAEE